MTRHANKDRVDEFTSFNPSATDDIVISHPNGGRSEIELQKPLLVAMARENKYEPCSDETDGDECVDRIFDEALCDVAELALDTAGLNENLVALPKLRALMIRVARNLDSFEELSTHISQYSPEEIEDFGLHTAYGTSTYTKAAKKLRKEDTFELLIEATFITVHALFWNGVPIPESVKNQYDLSYDAGPAASDFSRGTRQLALYTLAEDLIEIVVSNLDFQRSANKSRELRSLLGVFAHAAYNGESIENYDQTAQHSFELDSAFSGPTIREHIDGLYLWQIEEMFDDINQALLEYVIDSGIVSRPVLISYDLTNIQSLELEEYDESFLTEDGRWRFVSLSFTDPDLEFAFGLRLLKSEAQRARVLKNFLRSLTSMADVELLMADRGFDGREDIEACRAFVPGRWVILAQDYSDTRDDDYAELREELKPGGTAVVQDAGYENLHPPVRLIGYSGSTDDTVGPVRAFYTDMDVPSDKEQQKELITQINFRYNQRAKIESMFRMAKNAFDVSTDTDKAARKSFYFHMSVLFYNLYKIVNTVPAPNNGLELDTTQKELLEVIRNLAFRGPTRPTALTYLLEHS